MKRTTTGPMRAKLIRDSAQWGPHVKNLCDDIDVLVAEIERLQAKAKAEYQRGLEEGSSCQAILEIHGRERSVKELRAELAAEAAKEG